MLDQRLLSAEVIPPSQRPPPGLALEWERFVVESPSVHLEQSWEWGEIRRIDGWEPALFVVRHGGSIIAGALILVRQVKRVLRIGYVCRGPLLISMDGSMDGEDGAVLGRYVADEFRACAHKLRLSYMVAAPPYYAGRFPEQLLRAGFFPHLPGLPPSGLMTGTLLIDLEPSEDELMRGLRRTVRQDIRKGEQGGVVVREGDEQDIEVLWRLMNDLCRRRGTPSNVSGIDVFYRLWKALRPSGRVRIDVAEVAGKPVVALMTVCMGAWAIPWRIGWAGDHRKVNPEKVLYWAVLRAVRESGCRVFDFNWVDTGEVAAIRSGTAPPPSLHAGITFFKMGFGGKVIPLSETLDYFPNPVLRAGMRIGGRFLLASTWLRRFWK